MYNVMDFVLNTYCTHYIGYILYWIPNTLDLFYIEFTFYLVQLFVYIILDKQYI
jgi:hypothetical protein